MLHIFCDEKLTNCTILDKSIRRYNPLSIAKNSRIVISGFASVLIGDKNEQHKTDVHRP